MRQSMPAQDRYRIPLFCLVTMLFWFSSYTYVPVLTYYVESLGASHKMAGIIVGSYGLMQLLLRIPIGILTDKLGKIRIFISIGMSFAALSGLGLMLTQDLNLILLLRAMAGIAAATWVDFTILFSGYYKVGETTRAIGTINFYGYIGQITAMYLGGILAEALSMRATFAVGALGAVLGLGLSFLLAEKSGEKKEPLSLKGLAGVMTDRTLISISSIAILSQLLTYATIYGFTPVFAAQQFHISKYDMGIITIVSTIATAVAAILGGGYFARKYGERAVAVSGYLLLGLFTAAVPFIGNYGVFLAVQFMVGIGRGLSFTMLMGLSIKGVPDNRRATAMGFFQAVYAGGMFIGPVILGVIADFFSLTQGFVFLGLLGLLTAWLANTLIRKAEEAAAW